MSTFVTTNPDCLVHNPKCFLLELTNKCNLECTICPRNDDYGKEMQKGVMAFDNVVRVVDEIAAFGPKVVLIGLGETLLYKRLLDVVRYIHQANAAIELAITTNATLPNSAQLLSEICKTVKTSIMFSVDGTESMYDRIRRGGRYDTFVSTTSAVVASAQATAFSFNMVVFRGNYQHMVPVLDLAHRVGVRSVNFNSLNLAALPNTPLEEYDFYTSQEFEDEMVRARSHALDLGVTLTTFDFDTNGSFQKCTYPWDSFYITWDGFLAQCCAQPFPKQANFGNVFDRGVMKCVNGAEFIAVRRMWYRDATPDLCARCHKVRIPSIAGLSKSHHTVPSAPAKTALLSAVNTAGVRRVLL